LASSAGSLDGEWGGRAGTVNDLVADAESDAPDGRDLITGAGRAGAMVMNSCWTRTSRLGVAVTTVSGVRASEACG